MKTYLFIARGDSTSQVCQPIAQVTHPECLQTAHTLSLETLPCCHSRRCFRSCSCNKKKFRELISIMKGTHREVSRWWKGEYLTKWRKANEQLVGQVFTCNPGTKFYVMVSFRYNIYFLIEQTDLPGMDMDPTSGTTIKVPVKSHLSPAWAVSTASALRITSTLGPKPEELQNSATREQCSIHIQVFNGKKDQTLTKNSSS